MVRSPNGSLTQNIRDLPKTIVMIPDPGSKGSKGSYLKVFESKDHIRVCGYFEPWDSTETLDPPRLGSFRP